MTKKVIIIAIVALVVGLVAGAMLSAKQGNVSGLSELLTKTASLQVGETGTKATKHIFSTCNLATTQLPLEASSTDDFTCSVTGVRSGDNVRVTLPSNSGSNYGGFVVDAVSAGTNSVTVGITNLTGAATSSFILATTSAMVEAWDN